MTLGQRIDARRKDVGLSQAELARRVGVRQSTINSLINGDSRSSRVIVQIARELRTTPAYLVGDIDDPEADAPDAPAFTPEHLELIDCYEAIGPIQRQALLTIASTMAGRGPQGGLQAALTDYRAEPPAPEPPPATLPPEGALAQMFVGLLAGIDPAASSDERAQLLAERLPIGLAQLTDLRPAPKLQARHRTRPSAAPTREPQPQS